MGGHRVGPPPHQVRGDGFLRAVSDCSPFALFCITVRIFAPQLGESKIRNLTRRQLDDYPHSSGARVRISLVVLVTLLVHYFSPPLEFLHFTNKTQKREILLGRGWEGGGQLFVVLVLSIYVGGYISSDFNIIFQFGYLPV